MLAPDRQVQISSKLVSIARRHDSMPVGDVEWVRAVCARLGGKIVVVVVESLTY